MLAGQTSGVPKSGEGCVEMIRALRTARRSAMKARTQAANQLQDLRVTAPEELRHRLRGLSTKELVAVAARFSVSQMTLMTYWRQPTSRSVRWLAVTRLSRKRSPSWTHNSIGW